MRLVIALVSAVLLIGCAASDPATHRMLQSDNMLAVSSSNKPGYDYQLSLRRAMLPVDTINPETRATIVRSYFQAQCKSVEFVQSAEIKLAPSMFDEYQWIYDVKCVK